MDLVNELYAELLQSITIEVLHDGLIRSLFYDPRFTPDWYIKYVNKKAIADEIIDFQADGGHCFRIFFNKLHHVVSTKVSTFICDSQDINEDESIYGDYSYYDLYYRDISSGLPILFMQSSHNLVYPDRCIIYGLHHQFEISADDPRICVYDTVFNAREILKRKDVPAIREYLKSFDRPMICTV